MNNPLLSDGEDLDIFDFLEKEKVHPKSSKRGKRASRERFAELKEKMVMRIYGASREQALEIMKQRREEIRKRKRAERHEAASHIDTGDLKFLSVEDLIGGKD